MNTRTGICEIELYRGMVQSIEEITLIPVQGFDHSQDSMEQKNSFIKKIK